MTTSKALPFALALIVMQAATAGAVAPPETSDGPPAKVVARQTRALDQTITLEKVLEPDGRITLRSSSPDITSFAELDAAIEARRAARFEQYGCLGPQLEQRFDAAKASEELEVAIYLQRPPVQHPDRESHQESQLAAHSASLLTLQPLVRPEEIAARYGIQPSRAGEEVSADLVARVSKETLEQMRFDKGIAAIEAYVEPEPLTYPLTTFTLSAYNPPPLPLDARGSGVNVSTFETGVYQETFDCLGNLVPANIDITSTHSGNQDHSNMTFTCLWHTAPDATFFHHSSTNFSSTASQAYLIDHSIRTSSISYTRGGDQDSYEFLVMDDFAYRWPFPVFTNPTANSGYQYEANWQCYNCVSVGNVRHTYEQYYELAGCTQTTNPDPVYGQPISGNAGDREMPHLVTPGIAPDPNDGSATDPCLGSFTLWCGTSISAPVTNGVAGAVISADARMESYPEMVKAALLLTAQNVEQGYWDSQVDGRDGTGVISAADAVWFAANHTTVRPGTQAEHGLGHGTLGTAQDVQPLDFYVRTPSARPSSRHLRALVTWTSNPDLTQGYNSLSDLDLELRDASGKLIAGSYSFDDNVEIIDIPAHVLATNTLYTLRLHVVDIRIPAGARTSWFNYAIGWTWAEDFFWQAPRHDSYEVGLQTSSYCDPSLLQPQLDQTAQRYCQEMGHADVVSFDLDGPRGGVHTYWNGSSWTITGNTNVCYLANLLCEPTQTYFQQPSPVYRIGVASTSCTLPSTVATLDASAARFCQDQGFDTFDDYATEGPSAGVHTWWTGSTWTTSGSNDVCYMADLTCRNLEVCDDGIDNDGDGFIDEGC